MTSDGLLLLLLLQKKRDSSEFIFKRTVPYGFKMNKWSRIHYFFHTDGLLIILI